MKHSITLSSINLKEVEDVLVQDVHKSYPTLTMAKKAELLGKSSTWLAKKSRDLGLFIPRTRLNPEEIYDQLDLIEYGKRKVLKGWSFAAISRHTALYCREQKEKVGYELTETKTGIAVKLYLQPTSRTR